MRGRHEFPAGAFVMRLEDGVVGAVSAASTLYARIDFPDGDVLVDQYDRGFVFDPELTDERERLKSEVERARAELDLCEKSVARAEGELAEVGEKIERLKKYRRRADALVDRVFPDSERSGRTVSLEEVAYRAERYVDKLDERMAALRDRAHGLEGRVDQYATDVRGAEAAVAEAFEALGRFQRREPPKRDLFTGAIRA